MKAHVTVLTEEAVEALALTHTSCVVDATLGSGGHAALILEKLGGKGTLIGIDADESAIEAAREKFGAKKNIHFHQGNFRTIDTIVKELSLTHVDAILGDLGWRMEQFSGNGKGFSFQVDEELLMTLGNPTDYPFTAKDIVNEWKEQDIANVLKGYGEERYARRIAKAITETREKNPINTTFELVEVVKGAVPMVYQKGRIHPATRTFQALRIAVNDELDALTEFIDKSVTLLRPAGRIAIITFHSLEDRIVKHFFRDLEARGVGKVLTKKPITPREEELTSNPRSRSAKLRIFKKHEA